MNYLFFSPYTEIWVQAFPEALIAKELMGAGHHVRFIRCDSELRTYCPAMTSHGLNFWSTSKRKSQICETCKCSRDDVSERFEIPNTLLSEYLLEQDYSFARSVVANVTAANCLRFELNGVTIGKYATYEVILEHKLADFSQLTKVWEQYKENLLQCVLTHLFVNRYLDQNIVDHVVVYNSLYSLNRTFVKTCETFGVSSSTIHGGKNILDMLQTLTINPSDAEDILVARSDYWNCWKSIPLSSEEIKYVGKYLRHLFSGKSAFTYSARKKKRSKAELQSFFGIEPDCKVILCSLSSEDERFAADAVDALDFKMTQGFALFQSNIEWVRFLLNYVEMNSNIHLIIRYHPRLFPNKRESVLSSSLLEFEQLFRNLPQRASVNRPEDEISLYDLAEVVDVVANATSNAGIEMLMLGIPVVNHCPEKLFSYPAEFNYVGTTITEYEDALTNAMSDGWSIKNSINAFRYRSFLFTKVSVSLHDAVSSRNRLDLLRIITWLRQRRNFWVPTILICRLRKSELNRAPKGLAQSDWILNSLKGSEMKYLAPKESDLLRRQDMEQFEVAKELSNIGSKYFSKGRNGNLNNKFNP
jgi:hypothetical protein